jgi:Kef-type K+ transport system membrane component KefB
MHETLLTLPLTDPVMVLAIALSVVLLVPMLFERFRLPGLVGLILAGIVIGPHGANLLARDEAIVLLSTAGLLYVMFVAGLEIDLAMFRKHRSQSVLFGILCFLIPGGLGVVTGRLLGFDWPAAMMLGAVIAPHTLLAYPLASRLGLAKRQAVTAAVGGTILTDTLALMVLTVVAGAATGTLSGWFWFKTVGALVGFGALIFWGVPKLGSWFLKSASLTRDQEYAFVLTILFATGAIAKILDIEPIVGAFLAGLTLNRLIPERSSLMVRVQSFGNAVFIPFFLLATGMLVNPQVLVAEPHSWAIAGAILATAVVGKWLANWITGMICGYSYNDRWTMFGLTVSHAAATLAVAMTGMKLGLFGIDTINGIIVMMLGTCLLAAFTVQRFGTRLACEEAAEVPLPGDGPERILLPVVNPKNVEPLLDLALLVQEPKAHEPIVPLTIVRQDSSDVAADVARAEKLLTPAVIHGASADALVQPAVRVSLNVASGIKQAATDTRSSLLIMAWNGQRSLKEMAFGSVIDQVLTNSTMMIMLAHFAGPMSLTRRVIVVQPPLIQGHPGFGKVGHTLRRLVSHLSAGLVTWEVGKARAAGSSPFGESDERETVPSWRELTRKLMTEVGPDDLVVFLCARDESYMMPQSLERLPRLLSEQVERNFLVLYAPELGVAADVPAEAPEVLQPRHAVYPLQAETTEAALAALFERSIERFTDQPLPEDGLTLQSNWMEVVPGAVIAGVRLKEWPEMTVAVGVCQDGLNHPGSETPIKVVMLCLTPADMPLAQQTAYLQWIGRQVSQPGILQYLGQYPQSQTVAEILSMT